MLPNLQQNDQQRKNCVIDKKRQLKKCKTLLDKKKEEFDGKEEQKKRERDQNIDLSKQNLKMTNVIKNILEKLKHNKNIFKINKDLLKTNLEDKLKDLSIEELNNLYHNELAELKGKIYNIIPQDIRLELLRKGIIKKRIVNVPRMNKLGLNKENIINSFCVEKKNLNSSQIYLELKQMFNDEYNTLKQILKSKKQNSIDLLTDLNMNINTEEKLNSNSYSENNIYHRIYNENKSSNYHRSQNNIHYRYGRFHHHRFHNNIYHSDNNSFNKNKYSIPDELKKKENDIIIKKHKKLKPSSSLRKYRISKLSKVKYNKYKIDKDEVIDNEAKIDTKEKASEYLKYKSNYIIRNTIIDNDKYNRIPTPYSSLDYDLFIACNQHKYVSKIRNMINKKKKNEILFQERRKGKYSILQTNKSFSKQLRNSKSSKSRNTFDENKPFIEEGNDLYNSFIYHPEVLKKEIMKNLITKNTNKPNNIFNNVNYNYNNYNNNNNNNNN